MTLQSLTPHNREAIAPVDNPLGMEGVEFVVYATSRPQALGQVLEMMGFRPLARHRSAVCGREHGQVVDRPHGFIDADGQALQIHRARRLDAVQVLQRRPAHPLHAGLLVAGQSLFGLAQGCQQRLCTAGDGRLLQGQAQRGVDV